MNDSLNKKTHTVCGFTLIELLVVIAIIALLMAIILPALRVAKVQGTAIVCLFNCKGLGNGWYMYSEENDMWVMDGDTCDIGEPGADITTGWTTYSGISVHNFVSAPQDPAGNERNESIEDKVRGFKAGAMWPYMENYKVYHCPSDRRYLYPDQRYPDGTAGGIGGYRSYSLGAVMSLRSGGAEARVMVRKRNEFVSPSIKFVWLEEMDGFGWNHRTWNMDLSTPYWIDPFAVWHNGRSTFSFADGHAEKHKWVEESTLELAEAMIDGTSGSQATKGQDVPPGQERDWEWARRHYVPGKIPSDL